MPLTQGTQIGPYTVVGWLGAGGMGEVYRASDPRLAREVAIKLIPESLAADPNRLRRFEQEARAVGQLNHPNILAVYDVGTHAGSPYIVSELLEGESLRTRLLRGAMPSRKAIDYARQIAEGLSAAHAKGIVHRDLKPDNLFLTNDGRIKILDFGIAKLARQGDDSNAPTGLATETAEGLIIGTVGYMSPEQVRGETVDQRSDLFNFGAILFEMLTGRRAFIRATAAETMAAVLNEDPLETIATAVSPALARIVSRCVEKTREARFQSARDLAFALEVLSATGETAAPPAAGTSRRNWWAIGGVAVALGLVAVAASWLSRDSEPPSFESLLASATVTPLTNFAGSEEDAAISPDGKVIVFLSDRDGPFHIWRSQIGSDRFDDLTIGAPDQRNPGLIRGAGFSGEGSEIWFAGGGGGKVRLRLMPLLGGPLRVLLEDHTINVAWSRDGKQLAYFNFDAGDPLKVADGAGGNPRQILIGVDGEHHHFPAFSPDGRWIYFTRGSQAALEYDVWRIPSAGGEPERLTHHNSNVRFVTAIDARTVLYVAPEEDGAGPWLWALDVERKVTRRVSSGLERYISVDASATGRRLVASVGNPTASLWSVPILDRQADERDVKPYPPPSARALAPRFGKAGLFYLSSSGARDGLWRVQDGKPPLEVWKGSEGALSTPAAVSPEGDWVAVAPSRQGKRRLVVVSADGARRQSLSEAVNVRGASSWSRDSKWIVTGGDDAQGPGLFLVPFDGGAPRRIVNGHAFDPVWSSTDDLIVYSGEQKANAPLLAVHADGTPADFPQGIRVPFGVGGRARFLPNGRFLVYLQGAIGAQDFWLLDLSTGTSRQLTRFSSSATMFAFDITADGRHIVFDRLRWNADLRLIDLGK